MKSALFYLTIAACWALMAWDSFAHGKTGFAWVQTFISAAFIVKALSGFFKK